MSVSEKTKVSSGLKNLSLSLNKMPDVEVTFFKLFWLFIAGSLLGVIFEGIFCVFVHGGWETHVVSVWGPFCILYGFGMAGYYLLYALLHKKSIGIQFLYYSLVGFTLEVVSGALLEYGLHMKAWDYSAQFMNIRGYVSLKMTILWGIAGIAGAFLVPSYEKIFRKMSSAKWQIATRVLSIFMAVNMILTIFAIGRWSNRHQGKPAMTTIGRVMDQKCDDEWMSNRFCEWYFID